MSKQDLMAAVEKFNEKHNFTVGQIVEWKPKMRHKKTPGPFVVMEVLDPPVFDPTVSSGTPYFREHLDVALGVVDEDGDFVTYHFDSRRFQPAD